MMSKQHIEGQLQNLYGLKNRLELEYNIRNVFTRREVDEGLFAVIGQIKALESVLYGTNLGNENAWIYGIVHKR